MDGIQILNRKTDEYARAGNGFYVGCRMPGINGSPLGNVFHNRSTSRNVNIELYRAWLLEKFKDKSSAQYRELKVLSEFYERTGNLYLVCWCAPKACHSEVIANAVRFMVGEPLIKYSWK